MRTISGAKVAVVGMKRSGVAAVELLLEKGAHVIPVDQQPAGEVCGIAVRPQIAESFEGADLVVLSPGVPADLDLLLPIRARGVPVIGEVELASYYLQGPVIGITGANGKTTTTALAGHILHESGIDCQVGGNIGTPPTAMVKTSAPDRWNVLELSSFQLETIETFSARIGVALNVTPDHLDRHHSFEAYAAAKGRLFETQGEDDFAVLNADDPVCVEYASKTKGTAVWFSLARPVEPGLWLEDTGLIRFDEEPFLEARDIPLRGRHNIENVMAASAAARLAGASLKQIAAAVRTFRAVEHRLEFVRKVNGVGYYNDSKATNVDATLKAIDAFSGGLWIILGGKDKDSDYSVLRDPLSAKARAALLIGAAAPKIEAQLRSAVPLIQCGTLDNAVRTGWENARAGDNVVLAPACASFDQFQNFEHRGRVFKELVAQLAEKVS